MSKRVAYLGIKGAYSEQAARQHFGDNIIDVQCQSFNDVFTAIEQGQADYGIQPIENSLAGTVAQSYELLTQHTCKIQAEVILHIEHALMALPDTKLADLKQVRSHPQALAQCTTFLRKHGLEPVNWYNTAGSAKDLAESPVPNVGAIASPSVAALYGLDIIATGIQDQPHNFTRFFVLGHEDAPKSKRNKTSLIFTTKHEPGALVNCLLAFSRRHINLTKIESRPLRERPWEYLFYIDLEVHTDDEAFRASYEELTANTSYVRVLGSYPAVETPFPDQSTAK